MRWSGSESGSCTPTKWPWEIAGEDPRDVRAAYSEPRGRVTRLAAPMARADEEPAQLWRQLLAGMVSAVGAAVYGVRADTLIEVRAVPRDSAGRGLRSHAALQGS